MNKRFARLMPHTTHQLIQSVGYVIISTEKVVPRAQTFHYVMVTTETIKIPRLNCFIIVAQETLMQQFTMSVA